MKKSVVIILLFLVLSCSNLKNKDVNSFLQLEIVEVEPTENTSEFRALFDGFDQFLQVLIHIPKK
jgi:hypothetical protein